MLYTDCYHSFVPLSPAIPTFESAVLYPGLGFLEATNLSEGRGTATPFRIAGAPWMHAERTAAVFNSAMNEMKGGVYARPINFTPLESKYARQKCNGIMLHVNDPYSFRPVKTGWFLIKIIKDLHSEHFDWAPYPTHVNKTGTRHLDLLSGITHLENIFEKDMPGFFRDINALTAADEWEADINKFLIYPA